MTRSELLKLLRQAYPNLTPDDLSRMLDILFDSIIKSLKAGERVEIRGFGSFAPRIRKAKTGDINYVYYRASKELNEKINH